MTNFYDLFDKPATRPAEVNVTPIEPARASRYATKALTAECENVASATEGTRNHTLNTAAYSLAQLVAAGHLTETDVVDNLTAAARAAGLEEREIAATIRSGMGAGAQTPRIVPPEPEAPAVTVLDVPDVPDLEPDEDAAFWNSRDILLHLHTFARARRVSPWAVLGVALARIVTATPHQVCLPPIIGGKASLNLFVGIVGRSGDGKGAAEAVAADALATGYITTHNVGSGEGIAHGYMRRAKGELEWLDDRHAVLFSVPEIDSLAAQGDRKGATLMPQLRSGWTGEQLGFGYADPTKRIIVPAHEYRLCLVAGIQPARAACLLDDADGGTPQRFIWLPAIDPEAPDVAPTEPEPWPWQAPAVSELVGIGGIRLKVCTVARETIIGARLARVRGSGDALDGHALLARLKIAAALALAEGRLEVLEEDWDLAGIIQRKSDATRADVVRTLAMKKAEASHDRALGEARRAVIVEETVTEAAVRRVCGVLVRKLRKADDWLTARDLRHVAASRDRDHVDAALERLLEAGQIESETDDRTTRFRIPKELT